MIQLERIQEVHVVVGGSVHDEHGAAILDAGLEIFAAFGLHGAGQAIRSRR